MELIYPNKTYLASYEEACKEYEKNKVTQYSFLDPKDPHLFETIENYKRGINLPQGYVPATYLWLVDKNQFIGEASIRHSLTEPLLLFGGNIGYGVRCSQWGKGYGTLLLQKALDYSFCKLNLEKVLLTCSDQNIGSFKVIENNGGVLQDIIVNQIDEKDRPTRRYWIHSDKVC